MSLLDVHEAASAVQMVAHPEAQIIFGAVIEEHMENTTTVIATGFDEPHIEDVPHMVANGRRFEPPTRDRQSEPVDPSIRGARKV